MSVKVKIQLKNIEKKIERLNKFDWIVLNVTKRLRKLLFQNWEKGKGADGGKFKPLTEPYKKIKTKRSRSSIRDLVLKGTMRNNLMPIKEKPLYYKLGFLNSSEVEKAKGNAQHAPNMMRPISDRINVKLQRLAFDLYTK